MSFLNRVSRYHWALVPIVVIYFLERLGQYSLKCIVFLLSLSKPGCVCVCVCEKCLQDQLFAWVFPVEMSSVTFFLFGCLILF